jgi:hypothetical protein
MIAFRAISKSFAGIRVLRESYSSRTLEDLVGLEKMIERLQCEGKRMSPRLFSSAFLRRTALRCRYSAVRASRGRAIAAIGRFTGGAKGRLLALLDSVVPRRLALLRMVVAFLILVPFDVWPVLRFRALGWAVVRLRATAPAKQSEPQAGNSV